MVENVIIIGGGPAGLAAAIYNARAGLKPLLFAGSPPGGQLTLTSEVENYPGFDSILGPELVQKMREQAIKFGTRIVDENVIEVKFNKSEIRNPKSETNSNLENSKIVSKFEIRASKLYLTKSILIATGAKALWLGLESETRLRGKGVSACATCDGFFFKGKTVAVVGGGDTAMEEALTLTKFASKVYIIHRRSGFRASKIMQERVLNNHKVEVIYNAVVEEIMGEKRVEGVKLQLVETSQSWLKLDKNKKKISTNFNQFQPISTNRQLKIDGLFIAIGHKPDTDIFKGQIELDQKGYIVTADRKTVNPVYRTITSVDGVFAGGDCVDHIYRQAATAVGMGVAAALEIEKYLESV